MDDVEELNKQKTRDVGDLDFLNDRRSIWIIDIVLKSWDSSLLISLIKHS